MDRRQTIVVPTTGGPFIVNGLFRRERLITSIVVRPGDFRHLKVWTPQYADFTADHGPVATLIGKPEVGAFQLEVTNDIDRGRSWEIPVFLAHHFVAKAVPISGDPAKTDRLVWLTGALAFDPNAQVGAQGVVPDNYELEQKVEASKALLKQAAEAGASVVMLLPAGAGAEAAAAKARKLLPDAQRHRIEVFATFSDVLAVLDGRPIPDRTGAAATPPPAPAIPVPPPPQVAAPAIPAPPIPAVAAVPAPPIAIPHPPAGTAPITPPPAHLPHAGVDPRPLPPAPAPIAAPAQLPGSTVVIGEKRSGIPLMMVVAALAVLVVGVLVAFVGGWWPPRPVPNGTSPGQQAGGQQQQQGQQGGGQQQPGQQSGGQQQQQGQQGGGQQPQPPPPPPAAAPALTIYEVVATGGRSCGQYFELAGGSLPAYERRPVASVAPDRFATTSVNPICGIEFRAAPGAVVTPPAALARTDIGRSAILPATGTDGPGLVVILRRNIFQQPTAYTIEVRDGRANPPAQLRFQHELTR